MSRPVGALEAVLDAVLAGAAPHFFEGPEGWWAAHRAAQPASSFEAAAYGGARADRAAWAFASGYAAALDALLPGRGTEGPAALCVTEDGPPHPRNIACRWDGEALFGTKRFVTLGTAARELLVLARDEPAGPERLVLVSVPRDAAGVSLEALPPLPFVPEIPHAVVHLAGARGRAIDGDGWSDLVKPFRTIEDVHVHVALLAFLVARGRAWGASEEAREAGAALLVALEPLTRAEADRASVHVALAGVLAAVRAFALGLALPNMPPDDRARLSRDLRLLDVAHKAREARRAKAWERLGALSI